MKPLLKHIVPLLAVIVFASCKKDEAEVIPRGKMADIYAEMLMTDQWISSTPGVRMIADTSLVYEPILQKYGYDKYDYIVVMDRSNLRNITRIVGEDRDDKIRLLMSYTGANSDVADPWYTGDFEATWQDVWAGCNALLEKILSEKF